MSTLASKAGQFSGFSKTEEMVAQKLAKAFSRIFETYVDPYTFSIWPARGYWTHIHQDCQRFTGTFPRPELRSLTYDFGSWGLTLSQIAKGVRFEVQDCRDHRIKDNDFQIEKPSIRAAIPARGDANAGGTDGGRG